MVTVKTIKAFNNGRQYVAKNCLIEVEEIRARELEANGLVERFTAKKAPEPENKMAKEPKNKQKD